MRQLFDRNVPTLAKNDDLMRNVFNSLDVNANGKVTSRFSQILSLKFLSLIPNHTKDLKNDFDSHLGEVRRIRGREWP